MNRRNTASKSLVLRVLENAGTALSQDAIEQKVKGEMDRVTIYRILNRFCEDGITHKITADDGKQYFALCSGCGDSHRHNHFHFRCTACKKVECLDQQISVLLPDGYAAQGFMAWVSGLCKDCAKQV